MRHKNVMALAVAVSLLTAACSSGSSDGGSTGHAIDVVTIANVGGQTWSCQFNPFNPANNAQSLGTVYEPLVFVNTLKDAAETPMLASSYTWGADKKSVVFTIRDNVKWSDGKPMTAADVAFTFNLMKKHPALDLYALWTGNILDSVTAQGTTKVAMNFKVAAQPYFYDFADQVGIVPEHIWSTGEPASRPNTWADPNPIGTGPYVVNPCKAQNIQYTKNPSYWQAGLPKIGKVEYPAYTDNSPANLDLATGKAQWGSQFIPGIDKFYVAKDRANHHYWFPPVTNVALFPNLDPSHKATSNVAVRQALAYAIDKQQVSKIGEGGYQPPASQTGVVTPTFQTYQDDAAAAQFNYPSATTKPDTAKATKLLAGAGFSPSHPLELTVITITGYTDWDASLGEIKQELAPLGVKLTVSDLAAQAFDDKLYKGDFDLAYYSELGGPTPYYELRQILHSKNSAPLGTVASSNYERYNNPAVDALFDQYAAADKATQVSIIKQIGGYMLKDVPIIPTTEQVDWYEYNTKNLTGWPTKDNPFAQPSAFNVPDIEQVLLHLRSK